MFDWILKYWIEILFSLVVACGSYFWKKFWDLLKTEKKNEQEAFYKNLQENIQNEIQESYKKSLEDDNVLQEEINGIMKVVLSLKEGLLSIQGNNFKKSCHECLEDKHVLTLTEYENLIADHKAYNGLGGNHEGDALWALIEEKAKSTFGKE